MDIPFHAWNATKLSCRRTISFESRKGSVDNTDIDDTPTPSMTTKPQPSSTSCSNMRLPLPTIPLGRPRALGTEAERAEARRAKVRKNVRAFRRRQKEKKLLEAAAEAAAAHCDDEGGGGGGGGGGRGGGRGIGNVGGVICHDGFLDVSSAATTDVTTSISARSSPGLGPAGALQCFPEHDYADPDSWIWRLPQDLAGNAPYQDMFLSAMQNAGGGEEGYHLESVTNYDPFRSLAGCGSTWFHVAMMEMVDPGLDIMNGACLASALTLIGRERQDGNMAASAAYVQSRALRRLRQSLQRWTESTGQLCPISLSMAALTCAMSELIVSKSWANFASHLSGVGSLLAYHNPASLSTEAARELFYGFRSLEATFAFNHGRSLFLADPRWINLPWKGEVAMSQHPLHKMLDIAFRMLPELVSSQPQQGRPYSDKVPRQTQSPPRDAWPAKVPQHHRRQHGGHQHQVKQQEQEQEEEILQARDRLNRLRCIASELDAWEADFRSQQTHLGGLHHQKEAEWPGLYDYAFEFTSLPSATAYAMYTGIRVKLAESIFAALCIWDGSRSGATGRVHGSRSASPPSLGMKLASAQSATEAINLLMTTEVPRPTKILPSSPGKDSQVARTDALLQGLRWARQALQSLEFFHTGVIKDCGWLATLFAFDAAWAFFNGDKGARQLEAHGHAHVQLDREREWCRETAGRFAAMGVPLLGWW